MHSDNNVIHMQHDTYTALYVYCIIHAQHCLNKCSELWIVLQVQQQLVGAGIKEDVLTWFMDHHYQAWAQKKYGGRLLARPPLTADASGVCWLHLCAHNTCISTVCTGTTYFWCWQLRSCHHNMQICNDV